jgi:putative PIG3 family NAD(P)H quinone oxidoreductase
MKVVEITRPGGPEVLVPAHRAEPAPGAGEILIRVAYAGVNRPDALQRAGAYAPPKGASDLPGLEASGTVAAVGAGVARWRAGDRVCALLPGGGYAEAVVTPADHALPVPPGLDLAEAAALPETCFTVWHNVVERGRLAAGESFLVHGGSSGIGTTAIQMARALGARVFTTAGSDDKCRACERLGAELAVNYRSDDYVKAIRAATGGRGVDVSLNMVGGDYLARDVRLLAEDGRLVMIAFLNGPKAELNFAEVMVKRLAITGSTLRPQSVEAKARMAEALETHVWPMIAAKKLRPVMDRIFPLDQAAEAHARMESSGHIGKIVLEVAGG